MTKMMLLAATAALTSLPAVASAAPTITAAQVTGPSGTVWNTTADSFYTLFLQTPALGNFVNPGDQPVNLALNGTQTRVLLAGDGFRLGETVDSDSIYNLLLTFADGNTLSGSYSPTLNRFLGGSSFTSGGSVYSLAEFSFRRYLGDAVSEFTATPGGDPNDYAGNFRIDSAIAAVPEPATWAMMIFGMGMVGFTLRRRTNVHASVRYI